MDEKTEITKAIQEVVSSMMERVLHNVLVKDPFSLDAIIKDKPLYAALVPEQVFKGSHFERRFVTPFGKLWEKIAVVVAKHRWGIGALNHTIVGKVKEGRIQRISEVLNSLEHKNEAKNRIRPSWEKELRYVLEGDGKLVTATVICDVYAEDPKTKRKAAFELKAPMPNSDQSKVSKEKLLKLFSMEDHPVNEAFYALPYNPYGKREDYAWSFPSRWFDMKTDPVVLIGEEFWNKIGGEGTYRTMIAAVNEIGAKYKKRILEEYLDGKLRR